MTEELTDISNNNSDEQPIIEQYQYVSDGNEQLITDKPSKPLEIKKKKDIKKEILIEEKVIESKNKIDIVMKEIVIKSNKDLYESYIKELNFFSLSINNDIIYDSSIDKTNVFPIKFEDDYFILYSKKYSYNGLKIQKINKK